MGRLNVPAASKVSSKRYGGLKGCDFSVDASLVKENRSPLALNMISDNGGNPNKRPGWRVLHQLESPVHNIWFGEIDGDDEIIVHAGTKVYKIGDAVTVIKEGVKSEKGTGFFMRKNDKGYLWFTTGDNYYYYDGETCAEVSTIATRPKILISRNPKNGGVTFDAVNLLTGKMTVAFLGNSTDKTYYLPYQDVESIDEVRVRGANGEYAVETGYTVNLAAGTVTFSAVKNPINTGEDNVEIDFTKTTEGYADRIKKCTISAAYGLNATNRMFLSGNPEYRAYDWYSDIYDPTYFGDTSYSVVGMGDTSIMGYCKIGEYLSIVKEDNQQDTTIFLRFGELDNEAKIVFKTKQSVVGVGAISKNCFVNLGDEPMFLSRQGVYAITSTLLGYERIAKNRSFFIDKKLTAEADLKNAVSCEWNGYYMLAVNGRVYILDGRHRSGNPNNNEYSYESYYWEGVPAVCWLSVAGELYFGTSDGKLCKFNTDIAGVYAYNDNGNYEDGRYVGGGAAIDAYWSTPNDDDGGVHYYKTLLKKGGLVVISPFDRSSGTVYMSVDGNPQLLIVSGNVDIFNWEDISFDPERFSFNSNTSPREIYFNKKKKRYKRLQIIIRNSVINEPFGVHEIIKSFTVGNFSK